MIERLRRRQRKTHIAPRLVPLQEHVDRRHGGEQRIGDLGGERVLHHEMRVRIFDQDSPVD